MWVKNGHLGNNCGQFWCQSGHLKNKLDIMSENLDIWGTIVDSFGAKLYIYVRKLYLWGTLVDISGAKLYILCENCTFGEQLRTVLGQNCTFCVKIE
jgi:hypothetical protein